MVLVSFVDEPRQVSQSKRSSKNKQKSKLRQKQKQGQRSSGRKDAHRPEITERESSLYLPISPTVVQEPLSSCSSGSSESERFTHSSSYSSFSSISTTSLAAYSYEECHPYLHLHARAEQTHSRTQPQPLPRPSYASRSAYDVSRSAYCQNINLNTFADVHPASVPSSTFVFPLPPPRLRSKSTSSLVRTIPTLQHQSELASGHDCYPSRCTVEDESFVNQHRSKTKDFLRIGHRQQKTSGSRNRFISGSAISLLINKMSLSSTTKAEDGLGIKLRENGMQSEIWSTKAAMSDEMVVPPPVPARSRLRTVPTPKLAQSPNLSSPNLHASAPPSPAMAVTVSAEGSVSKDPPSSMKVITHRKSSLFRLPVDPPSSNITQDAPPLPSPVSPSFTVGSPTFSSVGPSSPSANEISFGFGKRRASKLVERDPLKIRDGMMARTSSSGVYTPPTFPGAQGPRPSHFPSHVYTPPGFALLPAPPPISPSASSTHSSSSSHSDSTAPPHTPLSPTGRIGKAMGNIRRFSTNVIQPKEKSHTTHQRAVTTPMVENGYYVPASSSFENDASHSRQPSWDREPQTPSNSTFMRSPALQQLPHSDSGYFPPLGTSSGLGMGLPAEFARSKTQGAMATVIISADTDPMALDKDGKPSLNQSSSLGMSAKGKRKPVPKIAAVGTGDEMGLENGMRRLEVEQTHAL